MTTQYEKVWTTAEGERIPFSKLTHQHLSNIYWYHKIFQDLPGMAPHVMEKTSLTAELQIYTKFDNKILSWKPIFEYELNWLNYLSLIQKKEEKLLIMDKWGHEVGEIVGLLRFVPGMTLFELN